MSNLKKLINLKTATVLIIFLVLWRPIAIVFYWVIIIISTLLSSNDYLNGTYKYSGNERVFADLAFYKASPKGAPQEHEGVSFVQVYDLKYSPSNNLCVDKEFTSNAKDLMGDYSIKAKRYTIYPILKEEITIGCGSP
jgi:hypothetical protein